MVGSSEVKRHVTVNIRGGSKGGGDLPPKTYESNSIHHDFVQFGKQHSRYKAILPSIVLSQKCCEVYFISLTPVNSQWYWLPNITEIDPPKHTGWIRPWSPCIMAELRAFKCFLFVYHPWQLVIFHRSRPTKTDRQHRGAQNIFPTARRKRFNKNTSAIQPDTILANWLTP